MIQLSTKIPKQSNTKTMQKMENGVIAENTAAADETLEKPMETSMAVRTIVGFITLLSVAIFAPALNSQALTGTIVNATLFIATVVIGVPGALLIGIIPSVVSALTGLLAPAILPMVPFIVVSNAILIALFATFREKTYWKGVIAASLAKFIFLSIVSLFVIKLFVPAKVASQLALMMTWPQLFTAISGGILAYFVLGAMGRLKK